MYNYFYYCYNDYGLNTWIRRLVLFWIDEDDGNSILVTFSLKSFSTLNLFPYLFFVYNKWENVIFSRRNVNTKGVINCRTCVDNVEYSFFASCQKFEIFLVLKTLFRVESPIRSMDDYFAKITSGMFSIRV